MPLTFSLSVRSFSTTYNIMSYSKEGDDYVFHCINSSNDNDYGCPSGCESDVRVNQGQVVARINDSGQKDGTVYLLPEVLFANIDIYAEYSPPELVAAALEEFDQSKPIYFCSYRSKHRKMSQLCGESQDGKEELTPIAPTLKDRLLRKYAQFKQYVGL